MASKASGGELFRGGGLFSVSLNAIDVDGDRAAREAARLEKYRCEVEQLKSNDGWVEADPKTRAIADFFAEAAKHTKEA